MGPLSKKLIDRVDADVALLRRSDGAETLPADAVTTSASGLDPHISPRFAALQIARVAKARGVAEDRLRQLVQRYTDLPMFGVIGEPRVNVVALNLALDAEFSTRAG